MERLIYFDHNSTAPYSSSVKKYLEEGISKDWYNPSSVYPTAQILHQKIRECRDFIANYLNCSPKHLFFTSGGTESINTILSLETLLLNQLSHVIITSHLEHHATLKKIDYLSNNQNNHNYPKLKQKTKPVWINNNEQGEINLEHLETICSQHPHSLLSFLSANNETGVITDIQSISKIARKYKCLIHVDAVQSLGKMPVDLEKWDVDFASFSGHKIGAMKGIGLLYAKKPFTPLMYGGGQERSLRPGTHNYPAIQSFKLAVQDIDLNKQEYVKQLRDYFENHLLSLSNSYKEVNNNRTLQKTVEYKQTDVPFKINCKKTNRLSNTSNIYLRGVSNQAILLYLAQKGICISTGSACNTGSPEPSHVITALDICDGISPRNYAQSCIRISLSSSNTKQEIDFLTSSLKELIPSSSRLNTHSPSQTA